MVRTIKLVTEGEGEKVMKMIEEREKGGEERNEEGREKGGRGEVACMHLTS